MVQHFGCFVQYCLVAYFDHQWHLVYQLLFDRYQVLLEYLDLFDQRLDQQLGYYFDLDLVLLQYLELEQSQV